MSQSQWYPHLSERVTIGKSNLIDFLSWTIPMFLEWIKDRGRGVLDIHREVYTFELYLASDNNLKSCILLFTVGSHFASLTQYIIFIGWSKSKIDMNYRMRKDRKILDHSWRIFPFTLATALSKYFFIDLLTFLLSSPSYKKF